MFLKICFFHIPPVTESHMHTILTNLDISKATGLDQIGSRLLKLSADVISNSLKYVINYSIKQDVFPDQWNCANVINVFKKGLSNGVN